MKQLKPKFCGWKPCSKEFKQVRTTDKFCSRACYLLDFTQKEIDQKVKGMKEAMNKNVFEYLQDEINLTVRLIDKGHPCMTSNASYGNYVVNAGHFYSVGSNPTLRYNLLNIFNQSQNDNSYKGGKGSNYGQSLKDTFGQAVRDEIESLPAKYKELHLSPIQAREALKRVRAINRVLAAEDRLYTTEERIEMRRHLNQEIGIYK